MNGSPRFDATETALVIGLGRSGEAVVDVLRARGAAVFVVDEKPPEALRDAIATIEELGAQFVPRDRLAGHLHEYAYAVLSPGIPRAGALVREITAANVPVIGEIEVAYRLCEAPIVAVSGTKGKSTTTSLIAHLFRHCGATVRVGGNIGNPLVREVIGARPNDWAIAEVSSFQLESIQMFRPHISVLLNLSADHLDRYETFDAYTAAKYRIFENQGERDFFIGNLDDERLAALHLQKSERHIRARTLMFTMGARREGAAMYLRGDALIYAPLQGEPVEVLRLADIPLAGAHNVANVMAAVLAALAADFDSGGLRDGVRTFAALHHRLEPVAEIGGILYVDDSKATNPGSAIAALHAYERPLVLIAGGKSKSSSFAEFGAEIDRRAKAVVLIGEAAAEIASHVSRAQVERADSMEDAVRRATALARSGDAVLLSPACASFDMFHSAEDRGERFRAAVRASAQAAV